MTTTIMTVTIMITVMASVSKSIRNNNQLYYNCHMCMYIYMMIRSMMLLLYEYWIKVVEYVIGTMLMMMVVLITTVMATTLTATMIITITIVAIIIQNINKRPIWKISSLL